MKSKFTHIGRVYRFPRRWHGPDLSLDVYLRETKCFWIDTAGDMYSKSYGWAQKNSQWKLDLKSVQPCDEQ